jgi:hypothetical protein
VEHRIEIEPRQTDLAGQRAEIPWRIDNKERAIKLEDKAAISVALPGPVA